MTIIEALALAKQGRKVRPVCWRTLNPDHWIEAIRNSAGDRNTVFVERGEMEEIPHALRLSFASEFLGEWEELP